jgi:hypothetical protein
MGNLKMMSNIAGARQLSKNEQKNVMGGACCKTGGCCDPAAECCTIPVPGNPYCGTNNGACQFLFPSVWIACGGGTYPDGSTHCV